jgi:HK97 family phage major capsid protein
MKTSKELRQDLGQLVHRQRGMLEAAEEAKRGFTAEEEQEYGRIEKEVGDTEESITRLEKQEARERALAEPQGGPVNRPDVSISPQPDAVTDQYRNAFAAYLCGQEEAAECRALSVGTAAEGGHTVPQEEFVRELIKTVDNEAVIRPLARVIQLTNAQTLGAPVLDADPADADWTTELATGTEDSTMAFAKRELNPQPVAKLLKVSKKLLRASPLGMEGIVRDRLGYKVGVTQSKVFNTGDGASKPLGIYTASAQGISTARDVDVGNGAGALDADEFITARYTLRAGYRGVWHFHRLGLAAFRKLKDGNNTYYWQPGLAQGVPSTFLDLPYVVDEYAPSTISAGAGNYIAVLGDFSYYWIAEALTMEIQRLDELYAATNQVGYIIRAEVDAMPVLEDAFVRLEFAA